MYNVCSVNNIFVEDSIIVHDVTAGYALLQIVLYVERKHVSKLDYTID